MTQADISERARSASQKRRITAVLTLNLMMIISLVVVGLVSHSLGVLAAGGDYVADSAGLALGLVAIGIRDRVGARSRATTVVAGINAAALTAVTVFVAVGALRRLVAGTPEITGLPVLIVSVVAAAVMGAGVVILGRSAGAEDLHMRSVLLDTMSDALAALAVAVGGVVILITRGWYWVDSAVALVISGLIGYGAVRLIRDVVHALRYGEAVVVRDDD
jgi:cation diffusion facilitator family transporter